MLIDVINTTLLLEGIATPVICEEWRNSQLTTVSPYEMNGLPPSFITVHTGNGSHSHSDLSSWLPATGGQQEMPRLCLRGAKPLLSH